MQPELARILYGTTEPAAARRLLQAGPLSAVLEQGALRELRWDGVEILRGIACLVRDRDWGTYPARIEAGDEQAGPDGFALSYRGSCGDGAQTLDYEARIDARLVRDAAGATAGARLSFRVRFAPRGDFVTNRAGFVVLHPLEGVAGAPVEVEHTGGTRRTVTLPAAVSPHQPLHDLRALAHAPAPGLRCHVRFEGDTFEMEDQRNWTDASFKTYVRPLALPFPYTLAAGQPIEQAIHVEVTRAPAAPEHAAAGAGVVAPSVASVEGGSARPAARVPALAVGLDPETLPLSSSVERAVARLAPATMVARHDVRRGHDAATLARVARLARSIGARVQLEAVLPCRAPVAEELGTLARAVAQADLALAALAVSPAADLKTGSPHDGPLPPLDEIYRAARAAFPGVPLGGGTFAYFTELNRKRPPAELLDFVTYTTCPIVHAADDDSVLQSLEALPWVFGSVWSEILAPVAARGGRPPAHHVGPVSLAMRDNPYGRAPADNPRGVRLAMAGDDPRQRGLLGAGFYLAYAAAAARAGVDQLALCAPEGPRGLCAPGTTPDAPATLWPAYHVARALTEGAGARWLDLDVGLAEGQAGGPLAALAWARADQVTALIANLGATSVRAWVRAQTPGTAPRGPLEVRLLDHDSHAFARQEVDFWSGSKAATIDGVSGGGFLLPLSACALARLRWTAAEGR